MILDIVFRKLHKLFILIRWKWNDGTNVKRTGNFHPADVKLSFNEALLLYDY